MTQSSSPNTTSPSDIDRDAEDVRLSIEDLEKGAVPKSVTVPLPNGRALTLDQARDVARRNPTRVIMFAGNVESGKTTLLATIFESFQRGLFAGQRFTGSRTLPAFEERCHDARIESNRREPYTKRTPITGELFLHLQVEDVVNPAFKQSVLLGDVSGEVFEEAANDATVASALAYVSRADHFVMLLDGEKLASLMDRQAAVGDARSVLRSLLEAGHIHSGTRVDLIVTKWDKVVAVDDAQAAQDFANDSMERLAQLLHGHVASIVCQHIASHSTAVSVPDGMGLNVAFQRWMNLPVVPVAFLPAQCGARRRT